jgi:twitching motility protein PilT
MVLEGILCQSLIPRSGSSGRCLAMEILIPTAAVRNLIREDKLHQIYSVMQTGLKKYGMQTLNQSLSHLVLTGQISVKDAVNRSADVDELQNLIQRKVGLHHHSSDSRLR